MTEVVQDKKSHEQLLAEFTGASRSTLETDLKGVSKWLKCKIQDLNLRTANLPAEHFHDLIEVLLSSYGRYPDETVEWKGFSIKYSQESPFTLYLLKKTTLISSSGDRHRIVAFIIAKAPVIPVIFASNSLEKHYCSDKAEIRQISTFINQPRYQIGNPFKLRCDLIFDGKRPDFAGLSKFNLARSQSSADIPLRAASLRSWALRFCSTSFW